MYKIVGKRDLAPNIFEMDILAPRVANSAQPGQFVIVITDEEGERIPLTICDSNKEEGTVNIVIQTMGAGTKKLEALKEGDSVKDFVGPLGRPSAYVDQDIEELRDKKILFVAGGVGVAPTYPQVKWFHDHDIDVDVILGAQTKELIVLEEKLRSVSGELFIATDDGSYGFKGMVTGLMEDLIENQGKEYDLVISIGPMVMMKFVALTAEKYNIEITVSLNPIMVDGTGMCGACRVTVGDETKFACVDGPEFDGHLVDFDEAMRRQAQYKPEEEVLDKEYENMCKLEDLEVEDNE